MFNRFLNTLLLLVAIGATSDAIFGGTITVGEYTRHFHIDAGSVTQGPNAPTPVTVGTYRGLGVNANNETLFFEWHATAAWDGASDVTLNILWTNEPGTIIAENDTVIFDCDWTSRAVGTDLDAVGSTNATATYTQTGGAGTDGELIDTPLTIDWDAPAANIAAGDLVGFDCFRDFDADTYGTNEDAVILHYSLDYQSTTIGAD